MNKGQKIKWGILGCGGIARKFVNSSRYLDSAEVVAVASETAGKSKAFATDLNIKEAYDGYEALLHNSAVDAVYVANTHNFHHTAVCAALEADKAVLCEKPLAVNQRQAKKMIETARSRKKFLMEAMWTRFLPAVVQLREWLAEGRIGTPRHIYACFGVHRDFPPLHRMVNPDLAGGAILDLGIYPISMASMVAGAKTPDQIFVVSKKGPTGVDTENSLMLSYPEHFVAQLQFGMEIERNRNVRISGDKGQLVLPGPFIAARSVSLELPNETILREFPFHDQEGFRFQIEAVNQCLIEGKTECDIMPLDETLLLAEIMDNVRAQAGVFYENE